MKPRVLVVDDDAGMRYTLRSLLEDVDLEIEEADDGVAALERLRGGGLHLVLSDLRMPNLDGLGLLREIARLPRPPRVIVITAHGSERHAVEAMKAGAFDYFRKPFDNDELLAVVGRAVAAVRLELENARLQDELAMARFMVFDSPAMARLSALVARVAPRDVTVLITGESGTGKERIAEALVHGSRRAERPFLRFNCAAIAPELAESELFGHERGAFTGAQRARPGLFRAAHGGTLLLDEIGELDLHVQAKLLRVLQEGEVRPVGEDRPVKVDVRLLLATHRDLAARVAEGRFREDLYHRINVVHLRIPPLRERAEEIPLLARHFLSRCAERYGTGPLALSDEVLARLRAHPWPGNVRELENAIEGMVALSQDGVLDPELLPGGENNVESVGLRERVEAYERGLIAAAIRQAGGNRSEAARRLGISRATLHEKMRKSSA